MADLDRIERERLLAQLRELVGLAASPLPAPAPAEPAPAPKLTPREQRRLTANIERLAAFKAEHRRLPSAAPTAPMGRGPSGPGCGASAGHARAERPAPPCGGAPQAGTGLHWHLSPRKAQALEQHGQE